MFPAVALLTLPLGQKGGEAVHSGVEFIRLHRLEEIVLHTASQHAHCIGEVVVAADDQHQRRIGELAGALHQRDPIQLRHADIGNQHFYRLPLQNLPRLQAVPGLQHGARVQTAAPHHGGNSLADQLFILRHQYRDHTRSPPSASRRGRLRVTPSPTCRPYSAPNVR